MEQLTHIATTVASIATVLAPPALMAFGFVPRVGPLRALSLGFRSRLFLRANTVSQRTREVAALRNNLSSWHKHKDLYTVVTGQKGVGKTCVVDTATERMFGVVDVKVYPGTPHATIVTDTLTAITKINHRAIDPTGSARRVLWCHRLIFREPATVVLRGVERKSTQEFADLDSAAKAMSYDYGLRVVIDASENSKPENYKTMRERVIEVGPMSRSVLESMPKLADLLSALKAADLSDVVWECLGGVPAAYIQLLHKWEKGGSEVGREQLEAVVEPFLINMLNKAMENRSANTLANPRLEKELYPLFRTQSEVPYELLVELKLACPSPDKVLRVKSISGGEMVLVPANAWTAVVLRFNLRKAPRLHELKKMLCTTAPPTPSTSNI